MKNSIKFLNKFLSNRKIQFVGFLGIAILLILIEYRFLLFKNIYKCFGSCVGSEGDTYYNLSIFLQRSKEIFSGNLYSLRTDHFTWFYEIIGLTSHNTASSFIFGILYKLTTNEILSYNLIYFGNLFFTQIGVLLLSFYYSKNKSSSIFLSLLIPLSGATNWNFYTGHIHAALFWALPFWVLFAEKFFKIKVWNFKKCFYLTFIGLCSSWLFFAEWHVMVFSLFWMGLWFLFKFSSGVNQIKKNIVNWLSFCFANAVPLLGIIPLGLKYIEISNLYSAVRTVDDVAGTNWNTEYFYFLKYPLLLSFKVYDFVLHKESSRWIDALLKEENVFPDVFSPVIFWLSLIFLLIFILLLIRKKKFNTKLLPHLLTFILLYTIALGPYLKIGNSVAKMIKLPHYYFYQIIFPLSAIRAVWRATAVGFLAMSAFLATSYQMVFAKFGKHRLFSFLSMASPVIFALILFFTWQGKTGSSYAAFEPDNVLFNIADSLKQENIEFFVWRKDYDNSDYNYFTSLYNWKSSEIRLNWVAGGTIGSPQAETTMLGDFLRNEKFADEMADLLMKKNVDLVIVDSLDYSTKYLDEIERNLSANFDLKTTAGSKSYWVRKSEDYNETKNLEYSITVSSTQKAKDDVILYVSEVNNSDETWVFRDHFVNFDIDIETNAGVSVYKSSERKIESPFLFPSGGKTFLLKINPNLKEGAYSLTVSVNNIQIKKTFSVVPKDEYDDLLDNREEVAFDKQFYHENKFVYEREYVLTRLRGVVSSGILNMKKDDVSAIFRDSDSMEYNRYYQEFPVWWGQPSCNLEGTYFAGDEIDIWCKQFIPADINYRYSSIKYEK